MGRYNDDAGWGLLGQIFAIAIGVFIGALAALYTWERIMEWRLERAANTAALQMRDSVKQIDLTNRRLALERQWELQKQEIAEMERKAAAVEVDRQRRAAAERKEAAWQRFFRPSAACVHDSANIVCANAYMAAKKAFDAQYTD